MFLSLSRRSRKRLHFRKHQQIVKSTVKWTKCLFFFTCYQNDELNELEIRRASYGPRLSWAPYVISRFNALHTAFKNSRGVNVIVKMTLNGGKSTGVQAFLSSSLFAVVCSFQTVRTCQNCARVCLILQINEKSRFIPKFTHFIAFFGSPDLSTARTRRCSSKWPGLLKCCDTGKSLFVCRFFRQSLQSFQHEFSNISLKCVDDCRLKVQFSSVVCFVRTMTTASTVQQLKLILPRGENINNLYL